MDGPGSRMAGPGAVAHVATLLRAPAGSCLRVTVWFRAKRNHG